MKKYSLVLLIALVSLVGIASVRAEDGSPSPSPSIGTRTPEPATTETPKIEHHDSNAIGKCDAVESKIKEHEGKDVKLGRSHEEQYDKIVTRISELITKAKGLGYDTTQLETELAALKVKIAKFKADKNAYNVLIAALPAKTCGAPATDFSTSLSTVRIALNLVRTDVDDIHSYIKNTIKPTVLALHKAIKPSPSESPSASASPELKSTNNE